MFFDAGVRQLTPVVFLFVVFIVFPSAIRARRVSDSRLFEPVVHAFSLDRPKSGCVFSNSPVCFHKIIRDPPTAESVLPFARFGASK